MVTLIADIDGAKFISHSNLELTQYLQKNVKLEIILTLLRQIGIPPPTVAPWREALYKDRQSNRRVGVF